MKRVILLINIADQKNLNELELFLSDMLNHRYIVSLQNATTILISTLKSHLDATFHIHMYHILPLTFDVLQKEEHNEGMKR